jgi:hypothetical protein
VRLYHVTMKSEPDDTTWDRFLMPSLSDYASVVEAVTKPYVLHFEPLTRDALEALSNGRSWRVRASNEPRFSIVIVPIDLDGIVRL